MCRVLVVDDEPEQLEGYEQSAKKLNLSGHPVRVDLKTFRMGSNNGLIQQMQAWRADGWTPDLILIDKTISSSHETGHDYVRQIQGNDAGDMLDFVAVPVVIHTKAAPNAEDAGSFVHGRADGYNWRRTDSSDYLKDCLNTLPMWKAQARRRVWQTLIDRTAQGLGTAKSIEQAEDHLRKQAFPFMQSYLDCTHGFVRVKAPPGQRYPLAAFFNLDNWARQNPTDRLADLPLVHAVLRDGTCSRDRISTDESGVYPVLQGKAMIGAVLSVFGEPPLGVITLVRDRPFGADDLSYLRRFAEQLGSVYGRQQFIEHRTAEQQDARQFAALASRVASEQALCEALAQIVHDRLNTALPEAGKATVRLVPPGTALLRRIACAGNCEMPGEDIPLWEDGIGSVYRRTVRSCQTSNLPTKAALKEAGYRPVGGFDPGSELCVPLSVQGPDGKVTVLGAVNAEHLDECAYGHSNQVFVETLAQIAAAALQRLRQQRAFSNLAALTRKSLSSPADEQWLALNEAMFGYMGHGALIHLMPPELQADGPAWRVEHFWSPENPPFPLSAWQDHFNRHWADTFTAKAIARALAGHDGVQYEADEQNFKLTTGLLSGQDAAVTANAFVPLRHEGRLTGGWVLLWYSPPALDLQGLQVLKHFADYAAELLRFQAHWVSRENQLAVAQQQEDLGMAAQMYEHVLHNHLTLLSGCCTAVELATTLPEASKHALDMRQIVNDLDVRASAAARFMKPPELARVDLALVWEKACGMLAARADREKVELRPLPTGQAWATTDKDILQWILFILVQNALDALSGSRRQGGKVWTEYVHAGPTDGQCTLRVVDNGPGISEAVLSRLGKRPNVTTKTESQGMAVYRCAQRTRTVLDGDLEPAGNQPTGGAKMLIHLPS